MSLFNSELKPMGSQFTDQYGRPVAGTSYDAYMAGASASPQQITDRETGKVFTSEHAYRDFLWKRAHGQAW